MSEPPTGASAFARFVIVSDTDSHFSVELTFPVEPEPQQPHPMAALRIDVSRLLGREFGVGGFATLDLPVQCLEEVSENLVYVVALARRRGWLPERS